MTLISTIIRDAYRESNLIAISADPTTAEQAEGLRLLNRYVLSLFGNEGGDPFTTIPIGRNNIDRPAGFPGYDGQPRGDWFVPVNSRLVLNLTQSETVFLHPRPHDGARFAFVDKSANLSTFNLIVDANGYTIGGSSTTTFNTNSQSAEYFFNADTGNWGVVTPLLSSDASPFPEKFDDLLVIGLAMRINPRNGVAADSQSVEAYRMTLRKFKAQYGQVIEMSSEEALLRLSGTRRKNYWIGYDDNDAFNTGIPFPRG